LGALYLYTIEFGSIVENGEFKPYGAGIASSIGEMKKYFDKNTEFRKLDPVRDANIKQFNI
jgi:phenylalanine-4-hydroxylase